MGVQFINRCLGLPTNFEILGEALTTKRLAYLCQKLCKIVLHALSFFIFIKHSDELSQYSHQSLTISLIVGLCDLFTGLAIHDDFDHDDKFLPYFFLHQQNK